MLALTGKTFNWHLEQCHFYSTVQFYNKTISVVVNTSLSSSSNFVSICIGLLSGIFRCKCDREREDKIEIEKTEKADTWRGLE